MLFSLIPILYPHIHSILVNQKCLVKIVGCPWKTKKHVLFDFEQNSCNHEWWIILKLYLGFNHFVREKHVFVKPNTQINWSFWWATTLFNLDSLSDKRFINKVNWWFFDHHLSAKDPGHVGLWTFTRLEKTLNCVRHRSFWFTLITFPQHNSSWCSNWNT